MALNGNLPIQNHLFITLFYFTFRSALNATALVLMFNQNFDFELAPLAAAFAMFSLQLLYSLPAR